jgi:hypothetical protein
LPRAAARRYSARRAASLTHEFEEAAMPDRPFDSTRREVLKLAGLSALAGAVPAPVLAAAASSKSHAKAAAPKPAPPAAAPPANAGDEKPLSDDAKALLEIVKRRYGAHLDDAQLAGIGKEIDGRLDSGRALRAAKLTNADEPDSTFHA